MKTIIASLLFVGFAIAEVDAQTGAGSFMIGGSAGISRNSHHGSPDVATVSPVNLSVSPTVGYFPINNLMTGITAGYTYNRMDQNGEKARTNGYSVGPILRYYVPFKTRFAAFAETAATYGKSISTSKGVSQGIDFNEKSRYVNYIYRAGAGVTWFVSPNIGIEGIVGYRQNNEKSFSEWISYVYANIAIQFYLPRKNQ
ncbi:MAG: hypothetical protein WDO15_17930 [Bacteroidota bacterium]